ncbi:unnamed protein product [Bursaphelenchus xylophilus]|uniref:(pine wood nematode) hypothetical protein n=1 Tax=Bursaphelenchus xylophilus TaxID=6326 RepID=A0A1I7RLD3_BURXY|nr:unnamed protein product [Bursaphelenchus xylophilus]CAG9083126.1 unnamed protein product [Bursaphelenchus xylophilus]
MRAVVGSATKGTKLYLIIVGLLSTEREKADGSRRNAEEPKKKASRLSNFAVLSRPIAVSPHWVRSLGWRRLLAARKWRVSPALALCPPSAYYYMELELWRSLLLYVFECPHFLPKKPHSDVKNVGNA